MNQDIVSVSELESLIFPNDPLRDRTPVYTKDGNRVHARFAVLKFGSEQFNTMYAGDQNYQIISREYGFKGRVQNYFVLGTLVLFEEWLREHEPNELCANCHDTGISIKDDDRRIRCTHCNLGEMVKKYFYQPSVYEEMEKTRMEEELSEKRHKELINLRDELKQRRLSGFKKEEKPLDSDKAKV
jgi:hypothetical protein